MLAVLQSLMRCGLNYDLMNEKSMVPIEKIDTASAISSIETYLLDLQNRICQFVEKEDGQGTFSEEIWQHKQGGGGKSRSLTSSIIEKAEDEVIDIANISNKVSQ